MATKKPAKRPAYQRLLHTTPIPPHSMVPTARPHKPVGKSPRPPGDPVAVPKRYPRFVKPPPANVTSLTLPLDVVLPDEAQMVANTGVLVFHSVGDTGGIHGDNVEKAIAEAMDQQISDEAANQAVPAFYYNLGDVVYFNGESKLYDSQFYEPYQNYHATIFAIAGNHDGDTATRKNDPVDTEPSLFGFMRNFCDTMSHHDSPYRATMTQPYVYWTLETPVATVIGLYSNVDGTLDARGTSEQQQWFEAQMANAATDKALLIAVHHPPFSLDTTHGGYPDIGIAIDRAIQGSGRLPTAVLSGHVHSYQQFERDLGGKKIPYIVAGAGGYANIPKLMHKIELGRNGKPLPNGFKTTRSEVKLMKHNDHEPGFLRVTVDGNKKTVTFDYFLVPFSGAPDARPWDTVVARW